MKGVERDECEKERREGNRQKTGVKEERERSKSERQTRETRD